MGKIISWFASVLIIGLFYVTNLWSKSQDGTAQDVSQSDTVQDVNFKN